MKHFILQTIRFYQKTLSPDHGPLAGASMMRCRYYPSCSEYGFRAIERHGVLKGSVKTITRIARCNPLFEGGVDESYI